MNPEHIERLRQEQQNAISQTKDAITKLENFKDDYKALATRLSTLPDKVRHQVMVPMGKKAFMPGELVHTNEIMVLLGDNWFVERSAKQAINIISRRIAGIDRQIEGLSKQKGLLEPRLGFTSQMAQETEQKDVVEITEGYNPVEEEKWKEDHRKNVQKYRQQLREQKQRQQEAKNSSARKSEGTDQELWARLDALELQEQQRQEMLRNDYSDTEMSTISTHTRSVTFQDVDPGSETESVGDSEGDGESDNDQKAARPNMITFKHTHLEESDQANTTAAPPGEASSDTITSPADIYRLFLPTQVKSILKPTSETQPDRRQHVECTGHLGVTFKDDMTKTTAPPTSCQTDLNIQAAGAMQAFTGTVVEKDPTSQTMASTPSDDIGLQKPAAGTREPPTRMSKFKQKRLQQDKR